MLAEIRTIKPNQWIRPYLLDEGASIRQNGIVVNKVDLTQQLIGDKNLIPLNIHVADFYAHSIPVVNLSTIKAEAWSLNLVEYGLSTVIENPEAARPYFDGPNTIHQIKLEYLELLRGLKFMVKLPDLDRPLVARPLTGALFRQGQIELCQFSQPNTQDLISTFAMDEVLKIRDRNLPALICPDPTNILEAISPRKLGFLVVSSEPDYLSQIQVCFKVGKHPKV